MSHPKLNLSVPRLMAIVNATPDSFSDGGQLYTQQALDLDRVKRRIAQIIEDGADILDIGGESTRPGAEPVSLQEEMDRVLPIVEWAAENTNLALSVDTSSPEVMTEAAAKGAHLINDVRALSRPGALVAAASSGLHICLMHMQGSPGSMQHKPQYNDPVAEVSHYLQERAVTCLSQGIAKDKLWIDPGFGFGKTLTHNLSLMRQMTELVSLGFPVLVGVSRKSMFGQLLNRELDQRLAGSLSFGLMALERGAKILRVHDIKETRDVIDSYIAIDQT